MCQSGTGLNKNGTKGCKNTCLMQVLLNVYRFLCMQTVWEVEMGYSITCIRLKSTVY